jgi:hypothetical protein
MFLFSKVFSTEHKKKHEKHIQKRIGKLVSAISACCYLVMEMDGYSPKYGTKKCPKIETQPHISDRKPPPNPQGVAFHNAGIPINQSDERDARTTAVGTLEVQIKDPSLGKAFFEINKTINYIYIYVIEYNIL